MDMVTKKPVVAPTEVTPRAKRRTYSPAFKRTILAEADAAAAEPGQVAALLRRHGLYFSHLTEWRRARDAGALAKAAPVRRGPTPAATPKEAERVRALEAPVPTTNRASAVLPGPAVAKPIPSCRNSWGKAMGWAAVQVASAVSTR